MSEPKVDQVPKITVLPDAGPEEMARSAGVTTEELGFNRIPRARSEGFSAEQQDAQEPQSERRRQLTEPRRASIFGSRAGHGVNMANIQYHGEPDPDA